MDHDKNSYSLTFFFSTLSLLLTSCGGGGGGNDTTQPSNNVSINQQAKITPQSVEEYLIGIDLWFSRDLTGYVTEFFAGGTLTFQTGEIDLTVENGCGGTVSISGSLDESASTGSLSITFTDYQHCSYNGTYTTTGSFDLSIYDAKGAPYNESLIIPSNFVLSTNDAVLNVESDTFQLVGNIEYDHDTSHADHSVLTLVKNFNISNSSGEAGFINFIDQVYYTDKLFLYPRGSLSLHYSGRLYDSDYGYVDIAMVNAPTVCYSRTMTTCPLDPEKLGKVEMVGENSSAQIYFDYGEYVSIDSDGDGTYDQDIFCNNGTCY
ncbi:MAG: hypothetical protein ABW098_11860 [Candidatus Thiodiazotropha sp.]